MGKEIKKYIIGSKPIPDWVVEETRLGKLRFNYDEGELVNVSIGVQSKVVNGFEGDMIIKSKTGLLLIPSDKVEKFIPKKVNKEAIKENIDE